MTLGSRPHLVFVHPAFPGQFGQIAHGLAEQGFRCTFVSEEGEDAPGTALGEGSLPIERIRYTPTAGRAPRYLVQDVDEEVAHAEAVHRALAPLRDTLRPDLLVGHAGWGSTMFLPDLFPDTPVVDYVEFYYAPGRSPDQYRPDWPARPETALRHRVQNAGTLLNLESCDAAYTPTHFQRSLIPKAYRAKTRVIHDGVDTAFWHRSIERASVPPEGRRIVTYVARGLEAFRGFDIFMQVARRIGDALPDVVFIVVGSDEATYGHDAELIDAPTLKQHLFATGDYDRDRFSFMGWISPERLLQILNLSDLHIYLTVPFVLSWSLLNAMACGCTVLASDTEPVREVVRHGSNGLLGGFFDVEGLAEAAIDVLENPRNFEGLGRAARRTILRRYALDVTIPRLRTLFEETIAAGRA